MLPVLIACRDGIDERSDTSQLKQDDNRNPGGPKSGQENLADLDALGYTTIQGSLHQPPFYGLSENSNILAYNGQGKL